MKSAPRSFWWFLLALVAASLVAASPAVAHIVSVGFGLQTYVRIEPRRVVLEYNLGYSNQAGFAEILENVETNQNSIIEQEEVDRYLAHKAPQVLRNLDVRIDGKSLGWRLTSSRSFKLFAGADIRQIQNGSFDTWFTFESSHQLGPGLHQVTIHDRNYEREISQSILWVPVPMEKPKIFKQYAFDWKPKSARPERRGADWAIPVRQATIWVELAPGWEKLWPEAAAVAATTETAQGMKQVAAEAARKAGLGAAAGGATSTTVAAAGATVTESSTAGPWASSATPGAAPAAAFAPAGGTGARGERSAAETVQASGENPEGARLIALREEVWYIALGIALIWGAFHALAPGHGKSMVAAYLLGTSGRLRDAFVLGLTSTVSHTLVLYLLQVAVSFLALRVFRVNPQTAQGYGQIGLELLSGGIVFGIGAVLIWRRGRRLARGLPMEDHHHGPGGHTHGPHGHHHHRHGHDHAHDAHGDGDHARRPAVPSAPSAQPSSASPGVRASSSQKPGDGPSAVSMGLVAGMQPCTAGLALVFMSIAQGWYWRGLYLLVAFSLGLGIVLTAIATVMVLARGYLKSSLRGGESRLLRVLPLVSAVSLTGVGVYMVIDCYLRNEQWIHHLVQRLG